MNTISYAFFALTALLTLGGGIACVGSRRPIRSAMGLLASIFGVTGCYLLLSAEFLAAVQLIVYAGAVVILFIFVVMLLGSAAVSPSDARSAVPRYLGAGVFLLSAIGALVLIVRSAATAVEPPAVPTSFGKIESIGHEIFTSRIVPFELTGALLLVAVVGALAVARGRQPDPTQKVGKSKALAPAEEGSP